MNTKTIISIIVISSLFFSFASCEKDENGAKISTYSSSESHLHGEDCMKCHVSGGYGEGWFNVAGSICRASISNPFLTANVQIYTGPNGTGTLINSIEVDSKGNFYTTENIDFNNELYTSVTNVEGNVKHMNSSITNGSCNSCHGESTDEILM